MTTEATDIARARRYIAEIPGTTEGARNTELNGLAYRLAERFELTQEEHVELCASVNARNTPPLSEHEVRTTAKSAWNGAVRKHVVCAKRITVQQAHKTYNLAMKKVSPEQKVTVVTPGGACTQEAPIEPEFLTPGQLLAFDTAHDTNTLLGKRWICRGGSCLWLGLAGIGKSTMGLQAAIAWSVGEEFFGIRPVRPLVSLIIQGENDDGDLAEQMQGVVGGMALGADALAAMDRRIKIARECSLTGDEFARRLAMLVAAVQPDLVWLDPLNCYIGGDVSSQEVCSHFLRNLLNPIAQESGAAMMIVHHGNKPAQYQKGSSTWKNGDYAYFGSGSSELANWARATICLREVEEGIYELRTSKRGARAEMTDDAGRCAQAIYLEHSRGAIFWQRASTPPTATAAIADGVDEVMDLMGSAPVTEKELRMLVVQVTKCARQVVYKAGGRPRAIFDEVKSRTRSKQQPALFFRGVR